MTDEHKPKVIIPEEANFLIIRQHKQALDDVVEQERKAIDKIEKAKEVKNG